MNFDKEEWVTQNAGHMERYDWRYLDADLDPRVGYLQDKLEQRGTCGING